MSRLGYSVQERVIDTWRYGVPQFRQRLILVAPGDGVAFSWPAESEKRVTLWNAIGDLPEVEGGWRPAGGRVGWADYAGPRTEFQRGMRDGVSQDGLRTKLFDHITRPVREDDRGGVRADDSQDEVLRSAAGAPALPRRHLRRQVQAAGR